MENRLDFTAYGHGNWQVLELSGRVDTVTSPAAENALMEQLGANSFLAVDFAGVDYISSAGLRALLRVAKQAKHEAKSFVLLGITGMVLDVLVTSGMDYLFTIYEGADMLP